MQMKYAVQAICVATSFPWGSSVSSASARRISTFVSSAARRSQTSFVLPTSILSSPSRHQRSIVSTTNIMSSLSSTKTNTAIKQQTNNRVALLQLPVTTCKTTNIETAKEYIQKAHQSGAQLCVLPEIWNSPYATSAFQEYAEVLPNVGDDALSNNDEQVNEWGESSKFLMQIAKSTNMYIVGGSIPEVSNDDKIYNTCLIINPSGKVVGKHRKVHLFDVNVLGGICFQESETLTGGEQGATYFDIDGLGRIGVGICYDIRFPEYALLLTQIHQCKVLIYPGAFNLTTGPAHWELLQRARAVDGQCYVLTASPARTSPPKEEGKYPHYSAWGHSTVVSPWGEVVATCDEQPNLVIADLDMNKVDEMRIAIPTMSQKRHDLYRLVKGNDDESR